MDVRDSLWLFGGAIVPALLVSWACSWLLRRWAPRWGLVDQPAARKVHASTTPLGGGIAIWAGVVSTLSVVTLCGIFADVPAIASRVPEFARPHLEGIGAQAGSLVFLLGCGTLLMLLGLADDRFGLPWQGRLLAQAGIATACVLSQGWTLTAFVQIPWLTTLLSVLWIVALINAFNMLDNMDGLSAGTAAIAAAMLAGVLVLSPDPQTREPQLFVAGYLLVLVGGLLGFLFHNRPPARIFMGDAGSYFVGFSVAIATLLATYTSYEGTTPHAILAPLCVVAVPFYDMITVIIIRLRAGQSPFHADRNHFSHRLVDLGLSKTQAVLTIYLTTATCGLGAILLHRVDLVGAVVILGMVACMLCLIAILETSARRKIKREPVA